MEKLCRKAEIDAVFRSRRVVSTLALTMHFSQGPGTRNRVAIMAGKRVGTSVARNRARRVIWEYLRTSEPFLKKGVDMIWIARPPIAEKSNSEIRLIGENLLKQARLLCSGEIEK